MGNIKSFQDLIDWRKAHELVMGIYTETKLFPSEEKFGIVSQLRRAAISIPANIAERFVKRSINDKSNFYNIAQGSLEEVKYYLMLSKDPGYTKDNILSSKADEVGRLLNGLLSSLP